MRTTIEVAPNKPTRLSGATRLGGLWNLRMEIPTRLGGATRLGGLWNLQNPPASVGPPASVDSGSAAGIQNIQMV